MLLDSVSALDLQDKLQQSIITLSLSIGIVFFSRIYKKSLFLSVLLFISLLSLVNLTPLIKNSSLVQFVHGFVDVSIASGVFLCLLIYRLLIERKTYYLLSIFELVLFTLLGCLLYLSAFGFISYDIYRLGYVFSYTNLIIFSLLIFLLLLSDLLLGYIWLISLIAYYFNLLESNNLWDYLIDPICWLVILVILTVRIIAKLKLTTLARANQI